MDLMEKYLNEGKSDIRGFVDNVVRMIMGDRIVALNNLKKIDFDFDFSSLSGKEYNEAYRRLYKAIFTGLQKELKDMLLLGVM